MKGGNERERARTEKIEYTCTTVPGSAMVIELKKTNVFQLSVSKKNNSLQTSHIFVSKIHMGAVYR